MFQAPHSNGSRIPPVIHVCAWVAQSGDALYRNIIIGEHSPQSETDFFVLMATRALATDVITGARTLRAEGGGSLSLQGPCAAALEAIRADVLSPCERESALFYVMTRSGDVDPSWPLFNVAGTRSMMQPSVSASVAAMCYVVLSVRCAFAFH